MFWFCAALVLAWLVVALGMRNPRPLTTRLLRVDGVSEAGAAELARRLREVRGVAEAIVVAEDEVAYLKVDRRALDVEALRAITPDAA